ncbi:MAG: hypothetical protein WC538_23750 [Thermoanaerobaculia bacterium]|jgi:hypothetical protein
MAKKKELRPISSLAAVDVGARILAGDRESVVLRGHAWIESALWTLLACRLNCGTGDIPDLSFSPLSTLALAGKRYGAVRKRIEELNRLRNAIAHSVDADAAGADFQKYAVASGLPRVARWSSNPKEQADCLRIAIVRDHTAIGVLGVSDPDAGARFREAWEEFERLRDSALSKKRGRASARASKHR